MRVWLLQSQWTRCPNCPRRSDRSGRRATVPQDTLTRIGGAPKLALPLPCESASRLQHPAGTLPLNAKRPMVVARPPMALPQRAAHVAFLVVALTSVTACGVSDAVSPVDAPSQSASY